MASKIRILIIIFLASILEISFFPALFAGQIAPDVILVFIILWSSRKKFEEIWLWIILSGFILDLAIFGKIGINIFSLVLIAYTASSLRKRFFINQREGSFFIALALIIGGTIMHWILVIFLNDAWTDISWQLLVMKIVSNSIISIIVYGLIFKFKGIFGISESKLAIK